MSTTALSAARTVPTGRVSRKQILSLLGLVPLGVYVVLHLWTNLLSWSAADDHRAWNEAVAAGRGNPLTLFLEIFGLGLPILFHTVAGIFELFRARPNNAVYGYFDNLKYLFQRLSAVGLALFIPAHLIKARILPMFTDAGFDASAHETWQGMHEALQEPLTLAVYALGLLGISYHLGNGLYTAGLRWGLAISPSGRARLQIISALAFVALLVMSYGALLGFAPMSGG